MAAANETDFKAKALIDTIAKELAEVNCIVFTFVSIICVLTKLIKRRYYDMI